jgi:hypothetical protein
MLFDIPGVIIARPFILLQPYIRRDYLTNFKLPGIFLSPMIPQNSSIIEIRDM